MFRYLLICLMLFKGSAHTAEDDFDAVKKAAEQGDKESRVNRVRWYCKAAEQGRADAQYNLGFMYDNGVGVPEDDIQAYAWISLASAQGVEIGEIAKETLTGEMTRAEIAEAQKLSRKYREAFGPGLYTQ